MPLPWRRARKEATGPARPGRQRGGGRRPGAGWAGAAREGVAAEPPLPERSRGGGAGGRRGQLGPPGSCRPPHVCPRPPVGSSPRPPPRIWPPLPPPPAPAAATDAAHKAPPPGLSGRRRRRRRQILSRLLAAPAPTGKCSPGFGARGARGGSGWCGAGRRGQSAKQNWKPPEGGPTGSQAAGGEGGGTGRKERRGREQNQNRTGGGGGRQGGEPCSCASRTESRGAQETLGGTPRRGSAAPPPDLRGTYWRMPRPDGREGDSNVCGSSAARGPTAVREELPGPPGAACGHHGSDFLLGPPGGGVGGGGQASPSAARVSAGGSPTASVGRPRGPLGLCAGAPTSLPGAGPRAPASCWHGGPGGLWVTRGTPDPEGPGGLCARRVPGPSACCPVFLLRDGRACALDRVHARRRGRRASKPSVTLTPPPPILGNVS